MISWGTLIYGSALAAAIAVAVVVVVARERGLLVLGLVAFSTLVGAIAWGAVLQTAGNDDFFHDAPVAVFPVSWEDVGTAVWTLAAAATSLGLVITKPRRAAELALLTAVAVFLVDMYLY
jgi:hypothetical protein